MRFVLLPDASAQTIEKFRVAFRIGKTQEFSIIPKADAVSGEEFLAAEPFRISPTIPCPTSAASLGVFWEPLPLLARYRDLVLRATLLAISIT